MSQHNKGSNESGFDKFFEDLTPESHESNYHETIKGLSRYEDTGLREDQVHKLTDDIYNPLPPANHDG